MYPGLEEKELAPHAPARTDTWAEMYPGLEEKELASFEPARIDTWAEMYPGLKEKELAPLEPVRTDTPYLKHSAVFYKPLEISCRTNISYLKI